MKYALLLPLLLILAGCPSNPPNFSDALGAGYAAVDTLAQTTLELCAALSEGGDCTGSISTDTRDDVRNRLRLALELLDEARLHQVDGSADLASQRIGEARAVLAVVTKLLEART
jgi:hypothetical protein